MSGDPPSAKRPADRLYGRVRGHKLRPRQQALLDIVLPRIAFGPHNAGTPATAFASPVRAVWLEVGFGSGEHAEALAAANSDIGLIACEVFENGVCSLLSRLVPEGAEATATLPGNLRLWQDDARLLLRMLPQSSVGALFLMFPDPWPKARHAKRRFVHPEQLELVARALVPGGEWRIASDDPTYQAWVSDVIGAQALFAPAEPSSTRPAGWPPTRYEAKARKAGRTPLYLVAPAPVGPGRPFDLVACRRWMREVGPMQLPQTGGCMCGAARYEITQAPTRVYTCHCTDCQRATVSAFSIGVAVPGAAFRLTGKDLLPVPGGVTEAGRPKTRWVCPDCGICLCGGVKVGTEPPGYVRIVRGGTLDDTSWLHPTVHFYTRSKQPWVVLPAGSTVYETQAKPG